MSVHSRKEDHVRIALQEDVRFRRKRTSFDDWEFVYNALPEIDVAEISTQTPFLGTTLKLPLMITGMTGGYPDATRINGDLAEACQDLGIAMGVGSMRACLESAEHRESFTVVKQFSHNVPILANIGAVQAVRWKRAGILDRMVEAAIEMVGASALALHLNPLQELTQPEGEPEYRGVTGAIAWLVEHSPVPVVVKEVGAGISMNVAQRLAGVGVEMIDVAGAGGTSWSAVEIMRHPTPDQVDHLWDVGIPTAEALVQCRGIVPTLIASGGISNGVDIAKAVALGANLAGAARPLLLAHHAGGTAAILQLVRSWELQIRQMMFLSGSGSLEQLRTTENMICLH
ncbi:MAG: type 2 isopentenyl-diphosphate Delta-isomerase [Ignavibacteria bacterium]|nr:type 2 isopentenyl-diphosphate Delta-isomerase [Ignavibacteria bacterium]